MDVFTVNVAKDEPLSIVTDDGTTASLLLDESLIEIPPDGASPVSATVPTTGSPPATDVGETLTAWREAGKMVRGVVS